MRSGADSLNPTQVIDLTQVVDLAPNLHGSDHPAVASAELSGSPSTLSATTAISAATGGEISSILASDSLAEALARVKRELLQLQASSQIKSEFDLARFVARAEETYGLLLADELVQSPELRKIMAELIEI
jgi:hypothetical protein